MVSIMNEMEIDRNPTPPPDFSILAIDSPKEEEIRVSSDFNARLHLDLQINPTDSEEIRVRVSPNDNNQLHPPSTDLIVAPRVFLNDNNQHHPPSTDLIVAPRVSDLVESETPLDMNGFEIGDMVWGKVKSHPWWPGHIFNEAFASPMVRRTKRGDFVLVAFFGDSSYGWFDPAELIPFSPTFLEKSKQTTLRSFVKAVEESVDETSRRAALGLSCRCRNPFNFRLTRVPNYFEVDVVGYERNGIYSEKQIQRAREEFKPEGMLGFIKQLAVMPRESEVRSVDWFRSVAVGLALRRARFEEFDETYAQAFGHQPARPARDEMGVPQQAESFAPRVALLSGSLKIAEDLGDNSNQKHSSTLKDKALKKKKKKDKYVLKRRDDHPLAATSTPSLPDAAAPFSPPPPPLPPQQQQQLQPAPTFVVTDSSPDPLPVASDYVLQKRESSGPVQDIKPEGSSSASQNQQIDDYKPNAVVSPALPESLHNKPVLLPSPAIGDNDAIVKKVKKIKKHPRDDADDGVGTEIKKKKKKHVGGDYKVRITKSISEIESSVPPRPASPPVNFDLSLLGQVQLPDLVSDLTSLALDPFYGIERNAPSMARYVFLKFRSLVYSKSLVLPMPGESDNVQEVQSSKPKPKEKKQRDPASSSSSALKPAKLIKRPDDASKSGRKRPPSDRQEEKSAKRVKKLNQLKSLASDKKAEKDNNGTTTTSTAEAVKKPEKQEPLLPLPPKRESPTFLIMKFPQRSTLPSVANLKARFARFGPLVVDSTRVFWKSHTCRVQFKYKPDAVNAYSYVTKNDIFGQIRVDYSIKEVENPNPEPPAAASEPVRREAEPMAVQSRLGNENVSSTQGKLKSILKKPGEEAGKENQRVKFKLSGNSNNGKKVDFSPPTSGPTLLDLPPPPSLPKPNSISLPPPPPQPRQILPPPSRIMENRSRPMQFSEGQTGTVNKADISHQILSLMLRCDDVVSRLKVLPGFIPFHPL